MSIVVATDDASDAELVRDLLKPEFGAVAHSSGPEKLPPGFGAGGAVVLVLAFKAIEHAERYYLGLYRQNPAIHTLPHRTIVLCAREEVRQAFQLCKKKYFDDFVLFWPMSQDMRLPMSVLLAQRTLEEARNAAALQQLAAPAQRMAGLEMRLRTEIDAGGEHVEQVSHSLRQAQHGVDEALNRFGERIRDGEFADAFDVRNPERAAQAIGRLNREEVQPHLQRASQSTAPAQKWVGGLMNEVAPQLQAAREIADLAGEIRRVVLIVDDDEFQLKVLARILGGRNYEILMAGSGMESLSVLRHRRPDLILMDVQLPDVDGIEITRRLKASEFYRDIPVVMITGQSEKQVIVDSRAAGAVDFVVKPFERETLLKKVAKYAGG